MHAHTARNFNLDTLRGIAILLVVLFHLNVPVFRTGGWIGVDLFFVLSGFLIAGLLFREWTTTGTLNLPRFYVRRGFKIYPAFYVFLAATLAVNLVAPGISSFPVTVHATLAEATFTQNYFQGIWGQTWSLAVEEHFYLLLPFLLWFLQRRNDNDNNPFRIMPTLFMVVATVELALRVATAGSAPTHKTVGLFSTHLRLDGLMFGVLLSYYYHFEPAKITQYAKGRIGIAIACSAVLTASVVDGVNPPIYTFSLTWLFFGFGFLLCRAVDVPPSPRLRVILTPIAKLGYYSYSVYLWHGWACRLLPRDNLLEYTLAFAAAVIPGILMAHLIEIPFLALRNKLFPALQQGTESIPLLGDLAATLPSAHSTEAELPSGSAAASFG